MTQPDVSSSAKEILAKHQGAACPKCAKLTMTHEDTPKLDYDLVTRLWRCSACNYSAQCPRLPIAHWPEPIRIAWYTKAAQQQAKKHTIRCPDCGDDTIDTEESGVPGFGVSTHVVLSCKTRTCTFTKRRVLRSLGTVLLVGIHYIALLTIIGLVAWLGLKAKDILDGKARTAAPVQTSGATANIPEDIAKRASATSITLSNRDAESVHATIKNLTGVVSTNLSSVTSSTEAWTTAQMAISTTSQSRPRASSIIPKLDAELDASCNCWHQFLLAKQGPQHIPATAWVIMALSKLGQPLPRKSIIFLLDKQRTSGWWPVYPTNDGDQVASTYATALGALALSSIISDTSLSAADIASAKYSISKAVSWLMSHKETGVTNWKDYPLNASDSKVSLGISALVVHTLHTVQSSGLENVDTAELDQKWINALPAAPIDITTVEGSDNVLINVDSGRIEQDRIRQFVLPWMLIATTDAYERCSDPSCRAYALSWLDNQLHHVDLQAAFVQGKEWRMGEWLIALHYIVKEKFI